VIKRAEKAGLDSIIVKQDVRIARLEALVDALRQSNAQKDKRIAELETLVHDLRKRNKQNSSNSSRPPSSDPPWIKAARKKRQGSGKPSGGQLGHQAHARALAPSEEVAETLHYVPKQCRHCEKLLTADDEIAEALQRHQVSELPPIKIRITEHQVHALVCGSCGTVTKGMLPEDVRKSVFGPRFQAEIVHLVANCRLSRRGAMKYAEESWGASISTGSIHHIEQNASQTLEAPYNEALDAVRSAPIRHADETGWPQSGRRGWLWAVGCVIATVFVIAGSRAGDVFTSLMGLAIQEGFFVTDRYRGYFALDMRQRGICHAHIKRDFAKIQAQGGVSAALGDALLFEHGCMFTIWHQYKAGNMLWEDLRKALTPIKWRMYRLLKKGRRGRNAKVSGMCGDMLLHWFAFWTFASVPGMEPTNNAAEQSLRKAVLWRKGCFGTRSTAGSLFAERMLTVAETCRKNKRNVVEYLSDAIKASLLGKPAPPLLFETQNA
jgi:transposase